MFADLRHAVGHHAVGDEVFANILSLQIPRLQSRNQRPRILRENIGLRGGKEMDRLTGDDGDVREDSFERVVNATQELREFGADGVFRGTKLQGKQTTRREVFARGAKELGRVEAIQLRCLRVGHIQNDHVECVANRLQEKAAIRVVDVYSRVRARRCGLCGKELLRHCA